MTTRAVCVVIPDDLQFADLQLRRDADGAVSFEWGVIERVCEASGLDVSVLRDGPEDNVAGLIVGWYQMHRAGGGDPDPVADDLINEVLIEDQAGSLSYPPGRA